jgi:hypothetical protein
MEPGTRFYCYGIQGLPCEGLTRTVSTYSYGDSLEIHPENNRLYVVCADGSIQDAHDPSRPIGWELIIDETKCFYRITQQGFEPLECSVRLYSTGPAPPGGKRIGSIVKQYSRHAAIYEPEDDGEPEVTSSISFPVLRSSIV